MARAQCALPRGGSAAGGGRAAFAPSLEDIVLVTTQITTLWADKYVQAPDRQALAIKWVLRDAARTDLLKLVTAPEGLFVHPDLSPRGLEWEAMRPTPLSGAQHTRTVPPPLPPPLPALPADPIRTHALELACVCALRIPVRALSVTGEGGASQSTAHPAPTPSAAAAQPAHGQAAPVAAALAPQPQPSSQQIFDEFTARCERLDVSVEKGHLTRAGREAAIVRLRKEYGYDDEE